MAIRFDYNLNREIRRAVDKFNKKLKRAKEHDLKYLPQKESIKEIKDEFRGQTATRAELRKKLKELEGFNLKTASDLIELDSGELTTKYNLKLAQRKQKRLRKAIEKEIAEQRDYVEAKPQFIMRRSRLSMLKNIRDSLLGKIKSRDIMRSIQAQYTREFSPSRLDNFYEQFFDIMQNEAKFVGVDNYKIEYVQKRLKELDPEVLNKMKNNNPLISQIIERYDSDHEYNTYDLNALSELYERLYNEIDNIILEFNDDEDYEVL